MGDSVPRDDILVPAAVDTLPINFAVLGSEGNILWTNKAWQEFGADNDIAVRPDTIGINYLEVTKAADDDNAQKVANGLEGILTGDRQEFELEYPCHSPGQQRWFLVRAASFSIAESRYVAVAHIDITQRILNEKENERFQRAIEAAGQAIFITDRDGTITYVNPGFEKVTGYKASEALGRTPRILKSSEHEPEFYEEFWETVLAGDTWEGRFINRRKSGDLFYAHATVEPITNDEGEISQFVALQTEITDIEAMKQQLQTHDDILRHDLRTQLNLIMGYSKQLTDQLPGGSEHFEAIDKAVEKLLTTANKARALRTFLEHTEEPSQIDIVQEAEDAVSMMRDQFPDAEITINTPLSAMAIGVRELDRALEELIENAIVHSDQSPPEIHVTVTNRTETVKLTVADNGPGIPEMEYKHFETGRISPIEHGQGIGLDLVYWVTRRSGGRLSIEEHDPQGSIVRIELLKDTPENTG